MGLDNKMKPIIEHIKKGNLVPFIGAGSTMDATPVAIDWTTLGNRLVENLDLEKGNHDPIDILQYYDDEHGTSDLRDQVKKYLTPKKDRKLKLIIQKQVCQWPIDTIITTNYDNFLEKACDEIGVDYDVIHLGNISDWRNSKNLKIFKIHGDFKNDMVLTQKDYQSYERIHADAFHLLQTLILTRPTLFIGCSLKDPNFRRAYFRVMSFLKSSQKHYAFFRKSDADESKMWKSLGINTLDLVDTANISISLRKTLEDLTKKCQLHANTIDGRKNIFENFEKYSQDKQFLQNLTIRKETALGFICIPDDKSINIYDNFQESPDLIKSRDKNARVRKQTYQNYIKNGATVKIIVSVNPSRLSERGYANHEFDMLKGLQRFVESFENYDNFHIVNRGSDLEWSNTTIYGDDSMIESKPIRNQYGIKDRLDVILNPKIISYMTSLFDERFSFFIEENLIQAKEKGILTENIKQIRELRNKKSNLKQIEKLNRLVNRTMKKFVLNEIQLEIDCSDGRTKLLESIS